MVDRVVQRPTRYELDDGIVVYRASGLGRCMRELQAIRHGLDGTSTPDWMQEKYEDGHFFEPLILDAVQLGIGSAFRLRDGSQATVDITEHQVEIGLPVYKGVGVLGHVDAIGKISSIGNTFGTHEGLVEVKSLGVTYWDKWIKEGINGLPRAYAWQVSAYMLGYDAPLLLVCGQKVKKGDEQVLGEVVGELFTTPPIPMVEIRKRIIDVEESESPGPCDVAQYPCPFQWLGGGKCEVQPRVEVHDWALQACLESYEKLRGSVAEAGKEMAKLKELIRELMLDTGEGDRLRVGEFNVTWREEEVPEAFRKAYKRTVLDVRRKAGRDDND